MKKLVAVVLSLMLALTCIGTMAESIYPIDTDVTLKVWIPYMSSSQDASANESIWYTTLAKKTGINIDWQEPTVGADSDQAYSLMIAGNDLPDIILHSDVVTNGASLIESGVIIKLNDYLEDYCPNLCAMMEKYPEIALTYKTEAGDYYCFPYLGDSMTSGGMMYNTAWLAECGLEIPTTIDELTEVLRAEKEKFGVAPFTMVQQELDENTAGNYGAMHSIYDAFGVPGRYCFYRDEQQVVHFSPVEEGYREALTLLNSWYEEGLIDPDYASLSWRDVSAKGAENVVGVMFADFEAFDRMSAIYDTAENPWVPGPEPKLDIDDDLYYFLSCNFCIACGGAITTACQDVEAACRLLDYMFSPEGLEFGNYGILGESYEYDSEGNPHYTDLYRNGPLGMDEYAGLYTPMACGGFTCGYGIYSAAYERNSEAMRVAESTWLSGLTDNRFWVMPMLGATAEETETFAELDSVIQTYCGEMHHKFLTGDLSIEDDWDAFQETLESMNVEDLIAIKQAQLDRFNAR